MGSSKEEEEAEPFIISTPKLLPLLSIQLAGSSIGRHDYEYSSEEHESGTLTPPLHTSASVPFRWEEEPGKPRPCTALTTTTTSNNNSISEGGLELPPRLKLVVTAAPSSSNDQKMTKMSSPTTVLDGPYHNLPLFQSSSLRFTTRRKPREQRQGSFGSSTCGSPERGQFGNSSVVQLMSKKSLLMDEQRKGWRSPGGGGGGFFGSWQRKSSSHHQAPHKRGKSIDVGGGSFVFSSSPVEIAGFGGGGDDDESGGATAVKKVSRIRRKGSFSSVSQVRSHFWATIYKGFKQVLPLKKKSTSSKKDGLPV